MTDLTPKREPEDPRVELLAEDLEASGQCCFDIWPCDRADEWRNDARNILARLDAAGGRVVTPEMLAELRRLYEAAFTVAAPENEWEEWTSKAAEAFPALLDAAAERDALAATVKRVRALHEPYYPFRDGRACCGVCEGDEFVPYPCQTIRALDGGAES